MAYDALELFEIEKKTVEPYVLYTVHIVTIQHAAYDPVFVDREGFVLDEGDRNFRLAQQTRTEFEKDGHECDVEMSCHICGDYLIFVELDLVDETTKAVRPVAARCFKCGLDIKPEYAHLAKFHLGEIAELDISKFLKNIGQS